MSRRTHKPKPNPDATTDAEPQQANPGPDPLCPIPRPDDIAAPLTIEEEDYYSLLVAIAESNADEKKPAAPKTRVEFSALPIRARGVRLLFDYFAGVAPSKCLKRSGLTWGDLSICRLASPEFDAIYRFCFRQTGERLTAKALSAIEEALDGRDIGSAAASSARFLLERLRRDEFGDPRYKYLQAQQAGSGGGGITYNINILNTAAPAIKPEIGQTSAPGARSLCGDCVELPTDEAKTT